jgi:integrase
VKTWEKTKTQCVYRHVQSGRYYVRYTSAGKQKWESLETDVYNVARLRAADKLKDVHRARLSVGHVEDGQATVADLTAVYLSQVDSTPDLSPATRRRKREIVAAIQKTWPGFDAMRPGDVTLASVVAWRNRYRADGTKHRPRRAKRVVRGNSAGTINRCIDALRHILDLAVDRGMIANNPARRKPPGEKKLKLAIDTKPLELPTLAQFHAIFDEVERGSGLGGWGIETADFLRLLAFSGARLREAAALTWSCVDWEKHRLRIPGTKTETSARQIPIFPPLADLLTKIRQRRMKSGGITLSAPVCRVAEAQKSIDRGCAKLGIPRLTHHDFRHAFATVAIEAGVDIPTVSRWLGHADGGALAMRTYGHLRDEHSQAVAQKVTWSVPVAPVVPIEKAAGNAGA